MAKNGKGNGAKRPVGRPLKITTPERFTELAERYFSDCATAGECPHVTGLALALGLCDRKSIIRYEERPEFRHAVKTAKARCESAVLAGLFAGHIPPAAGIFYLKNFGWTDRQEIQHSHKAEVMKVPERDMDEGWRSKHGATQAEDAASEAVN